jgi:hypothetical protein
MNAIRVVVESNVRRRLDRLGDAAGPAGALSDDRPTPEHLFGL